MNEIKLEYKEQKFNEQRQAELPTIRGFIKTENVADATVAPTWTPRTFYEQLVIRYDTTPRTRLWIYDFLNQAWKNATLS